MNNGKSKHGGSEESGLVLPAGMGELVQLDGSQMFEPPEVTAAKKMAAERQERALQLERRRLALELLGGGQFAAYPLLAHRNVEMALGVADELIKQTGGGI